jgi:hypothetical protein
MPHTPDTVSAIPGPDPGRPIRLQADRGSPVGIDLDLTVNQGWDLADDLAAILARHPAPTSRPPRERA